MKRLLILWFFLSMGAASAGQPKYPVILAHGFLASDTLFSWRRVQVALWLRGYRTFVTEVSAVDSIQSRARQLSRQIDHILRRTGAKKVNLVAHSMGGLDGRYLITHLGYSDRVASLTTLSTPHRGSSAADAILEDLSPNCGFICFLVERFASLYNNKTGDPDLRLALRNLSTPFAREFNERTPDAPEVLYQSWAAVATREGRPRIRGILDEAHGIILQEEGENDGLVSVESAQWGNYRGRIPSDHLGIIGLGRRGKHYLNRPWHFIRRVLDDLDRRGL